MNGEKMENVKKLFPKNKVVLGLIILFGLFFLISSVRTIQTGTVGVVTRFGKTIGRELDEGLSVVLPFGIESVSVYDVKIQRRAVESDAATKDLQDVKGSLVLNYRIKRGAVSNIHKTIGINFEQNLIEPALSEVFKSVTAKFNATDLIVNRKDLKAEVVSSLRDRLEKYDIIIDDVSIINFGFSPSFTKAIEEKQVAEQEAQRAKFNLERAQTDALAQKVQSETLSDNYLRKQAIEKWDGKMPQYIGGGSVFNIPLN